MKKKFFSYKYYLFLIIKQMDINKPKDKEEISISESSSMEIDNNEVEECFDNFNRHLSAAYVRYRKQAKFARDFICFGPMGRAHYRRRICEVPETYPENSYYEHVKKSIEKFEFYIFMKHAETSIILQCMIYPTVFGGRDIDRPASPSEIRSHRPGSLMEAYKVFFQIMIPPVGNEFRDTRESLKMYLKHVIDLFEECGKLHLLQTDYKKYRQPIDSVLSDYPDILEILEVLKVDDMIAKPAK
jgi:hypothetical protein